MNERGEFAERLSHKTGLSLNVCDAWTIVENNGGGPHNWLNVRGNGRSYSGVHVTNERGGFSGFNSLEDATTETAWWINNMPNFRAIRDSRSKPDPAQLYAIIHSPWDAGHYGGNGNRLLALYESLHHTPKPNNPTGALPGPSPKPKWFWKALHKFLKRGHYKHG